MLRSGGDGSAEDCPETGVVKAAPAVGRYALRGHFSSYGAGSWPVGLGDPSRGEDIPVTTSLSSCWCPTKHVFRTEKPASPRTATESDGPTELSFQENMALSHHPTAIGIETENARSVFSWTSFRVRKRKPSGRRYRRLRSQWAPRSLQREDRPRGYDSLTLPTSPSIRDLFCGSWRPIEQEY